MTLLPDKYRLVIWKGGTLRERMTIYDDDGITVKNLTGYTGQCIIKTKQEVELLRLTTENSGIFMSGSTGILEMFISDEDTEDLTWKSALYELKITSPQGDTYPILYGTVVVRSS